MCMLHKVLIPIEIPTPVVETREKIKKKMVIIMTCIIVLMVHAGMAHCTGYVLWPQNLISQFMEQNFMAEELFFGPISNHKYQHA